MKIFNFLVLISLCLLYFTANCSFLTPIIGYEENKMFRGTPGPIVVNEDDKAVVIFTYYFGGSPIHYARVVRVLFLNILSSKKKK